MPKPTLSRSSLIATITRALGEISHLTQITEGEESRAFSFRTNGENFIVRINQTPDGFNKDAYAYQQFATAALPIPEIVTLGELDGGHVYCVSRRVPGVTLQDLKRAELPVVVGPVACVLDAIAASNIGATGGYGPFDPQGKGAYATWRDFLTAIASPRQYDWAAAGHRADLDRVQPLLNEVLALAEYCPEARQLIHGDFGSNNVLTDGHRITGVIDWSEAMFGDPLYDVANILFWRSWLMCMEQQARFFEAQCVDRLRHAERLRCYQLRIGLEEIFENALHGTAENVAWAIDRCEEL
ncbi:phosphotransferase family protein [Ensifer sp. NM-2]|uniref:phosphotransferase family protein n=1 Tax=Ensifer sp. NM-2 TaxID=2109730 RepID=UPI001304E60F|nr:aminoglycoside phosphotransferase family protein [Ensifer sp. NM-2]